MQEPDEAAHLIPDSPIQRLPVQSVDLHDPAGRVKDYIDWVIEEWGRERPDLDVESVGIISRLDRLQAHLRAEVGAVFERLGLTGPSFAVIATLRRTGKPYQLSQRALMDALQLTGGTISVRIDRLEREGIVERMPDPHDQRGVLVRLTPSGARLFDQVAPLHLANEASLLSALTTQQREQLAALLRILLLSFDPIAPANPAHPSHWLGASLAPAHRARKIRRSSGLPDIPGLLVQSVALPGPAADAGLHEGDLIISVNAREVRSIESLYEQWLAADGAALTLEVLRGTAQRRVLLSAVDLPATPEEG